MPIANVLFGADSADALLTYTPRNSPSVMVNTGGLLRSAVGMLNELRLIDV